MSWVASLARPEILALKAYEPASWEPGFTRLHANELPWRCGCDESDAGLNRYPEPQPRELLERLADLYGVARSCVLACRGSDEAIDLLVRAFCRPGEDAVLVCPPTFGMYSWVAAIQGARMVSVPLRAAADFALDVEAVLEHCTPQVKLVFLCSPNNPTGHLLREEAILAVADALAGRALVVVDEAYVEFAARASLTRLLTERRQLAILRTFSKAHGLAGARLGALLADPEVIALVGKVMPPYGITQLTLEAVLGVLEPAQLRTVRGRIAQVCAERARLLNALTRLPGVTLVLPSEANFILARFADPTAALARAREAQLLVRDVRSYAGLTDALRVTIGTEAQNDRLLEAWR